MSQQTSGLLFSYVSKSQYHDSCVPKAAYKTSNQADPGKSQKINDSSRSDFVSQEAIWKQTLQTERRSVKNWEDNWGFLTAYDEKGNLREKEELPETSHVFSDILPNTNAGNYGYRQKTDVGKTMVSLENKFFSENRRKKLPSDLICY